MTIDHELGVSFARTPIKMLIIGAGGSGSAFLLQLPYLHNALLAYGHPYGLDVTVMDADVVSATNCVRQPFSAADVGHNKAALLIGRLNVFWGLQWKAVPARFTHETLRNSDLRTHFLVGCVDTRQARREIAAAVTQKFDSTLYWLDLGNAATCGQFVLGQPHNQHNRAKKERLRTVAELYPEIVAEGAEDDLPSCSAIESLERQEPYVNQMLATASLAMLTRLLRYGRVPHQGGFFNAETGRLVPLLIDPDERARLHRRNTRRKAA